MAAYLHPLQSMLDPLREQLQVFPEKMPKTFPAAALQLFQKEESQGIFAFPCHSWQFRHRLASKALADHCQGF